MTEENQQPRAAKFIITLGVLVVVGLSVGAMVVSFSKIPDLSNAETETEEEGESEPLRVRRAAVSGEFYPGNSLELTEMLDKLFETAVKTEIDGDVRALIVPHAGYTYSGVVAAAGYAALEGEFRRVIIIASNHVSGVERFRLSVPDVSFYEMSLGKIPVSGIVADLLKQPLFSYVPEAHTSHVIEVQLPFLQQRFSEFEIVPIITDALSDEDIRDAAQLVSEYLTSDTLLVVSTDLSHYHPYKRAVGLDKPCIKWLEALDRENAKKCSACGLPAARILIEVARERGWKGQIIDYQNSGDTGGLKQRVVGYSSIAYFEKRVSPKEKEQLLALSRRVLKTNVSKGRMPKLNRRRFSERLRKVQGCFVTLEKDHELRGCIGHIIPQKPLYQCVVENTVAAARHDPRFPPVSKEELKDLEIEISLLSVPRRVNNDTPESLLSALIPNKTGVILKRGLRSSTYLPQVWEQLPDKQEFLSRLCEKGGLPADCWQDPRTEVKTYEAEVFRE